MGAGCEARGRGCSLWWGAVPRITVRQRASRGSGYGGFAVGSAYAVHIHLTECEGQLRGVPWLRGRWCPCSRNRLPEPAYGCPGKVVGHQTVLGRLGKPGAGNGCGLRLYQNKYGGVIRPKTRGMGDLGLERDFFAHRYFYRIPFSAGLFGGVDDLVYAGTATTDQKKPERVSVIPTPDQTPPSTSTLRVSPGPSKQNTACIAMWGVSGGV